MWASATEIAKFIIISILSALPLGLISSLLGQSLSKVVLVYLGIAIIAALVTSFFRSWLTRERFIKKRLLENGHYAKLIEEVS